MKYERVDDYEIGFSTTEWTIMCTIHIQCHHKIMYGYCIVLYNKVVQLFYLDGYNNNVYFSFYRLISIYFLNNVYNLFIFN